MIKSCAKLKTMVLFNKVTHIVWTRVWCIVIVTLMVMVLEASALNGPNVCMVKQKYNITKRVKYRAPMSVRTYEWCFSMPPRCSKWNTEMRDLTRLETEERTAEVAICCPGYKMKDVSCVPICPSGKTGSGCSEGCPRNKWGPNCVHDCGPCEHGACVPTTGECVCQDGWQGESCGISMPTTTTSKKTTVDAILTTRPTTKISTSPITTPTIAITPRIPTSEQKTTSHARTTESRTSTSSIKPTSILTSTKITSSPATVNTEKQRDPTIMTTAKYLLNESTTLFNNISMTILSTREGINEEGHTMITTSIYNRTETAVTNVADVTTVSHIIPKPTTYMTENPLMTKKYTEKATKSSISSTALIELTTEVTFTTTDIPATTIITPIRETTTLTPIISKEISKIETTKPETTVKIIPTTTKFKPKEIWIKPAQKGESSIETKKMFDLSRHRSAINHEVTINTTPKTIIVSIIPTSVSYASFKKIALTTTSFTAQKNNTTIRAYNKLTQGYTRPMLVETYTPTPGIYNRSSLTPTNLSSSTETIRNTTTARPANISSLTAKHLKTESMPFSNIINSTIEITSSTNALLNSSTFVTTVSSTNVMKTTQQTNISSKTTPKIHTTTRSMKGMKHDMVRTKHILVSSNKNVTRSIVRNITITTASTITKELEQTKQTKKTNRITTEDPTDEETFHILTEPEHITAVMGVKESGRSSVDLISVISIAGGVMMTVITVAVIIVMIERCKRPRYEDVRKINDIRMQVMIDNNDAPPPYVRSIFHTPLPDPPSSEKCHYQPISTLDRNLKQFMRPVVVQTISPIMLENFRGILECHYDHLPRRSHDFATIQTRHSIAPSMSTSSELRHLRARSVTESTIDALKCEAKLDVIDNTTSEPLYAEIPCWRPPSEHAIEIININGEAVTEL